MMKPHVLGIAALLTLLCSSCSREAEPTVMKVYHDGNEYEIIKKGDVTDQGQPAHFIRYYSKKPFNESIRTAEQADILAIVAKHIETDKHQRIVIIAVEKKGRLFGLLKAREHRESVPAEEVLKYHPEAKIKSGE